MPFFDSDGANLASWNFTVNHISACVESPCNRWPILQA